MHTSIPVLIIKEKLKKFDRNGKLSSSLIHRNE